MAFLLLDNPKEATDYCNFARTQSYNYPITNFIRCMLVNGNENGVRNWHLKLLCAIVFVVKHFLNKYYPLTQIEPDIRVVSKMSTFSGDKRRSLATDYLVWCRKLMGKESMFLCTYRLQIYKLFNSLDSTNAATFLNSINHVFYGTYMDKNTLTDLECGFMHPLQFIIQIMSDGYLSDINDFSKIIERMGESIPKEFRIYVNSININDFPAHRKTPIKVDYKIAPGVNGTSVERGECLIINQMFLNDEKRRRHGTEKDEQELIKSMSKIGCENRITVHRDLSKREIFNCITKFRELVEKSLPDFTVVVILSHGNQNPKTGHDEIMDIHMNGIPIWKIKNSLIDGNKCPAMIGKPKLFFVQACRGKKEQIPSWGMYRYLCET